jgi:hypothetical protein
MSKQVLSVAILFVFTVWGVRAQSPTAKFPHWSLEVTGGPAFPVGKFASKALNSNESGHAHIGPGAELAVTRRLTRAIGLVLTAGSEKNPIGTYSTLINPGSGGFTIKNEPWMIARFGLGLDYAHSLSSRLSFDLRATAGLLKSRVPGYSYHLPPYNYLYIATNTVEIQIISSSRALPWAFAYAAGADLKWRVKGRLFLVATASFAASNFDFRYSYVDQFTGSMNYPTSTVDHHQPIAVIQTGLGAGVTL